MYEYTASDNLYLDRKFVELREGCLLCGGLKAGCACAYRLYTEEVRVRSEIPSKYRESSNIDLLEGRNGVGAKSAIESYLKDLAKNVGAGTGLFLWGPQSSGKTNVACYVMNSILNNAHAYASGTIPSLEHLMLYLHCGSLFDRLVSKAGTHKYPTGEELRALMDTVQFLCLDDVDSIYTPKKLEESWIENVLATVFRTRANGNLPLILTSSLSLQELKDRNTLIGGRLAGSIREHMQCIKLPPAPLNNGVEHGHQTSAKGVSSKKVQGVAGTHAGSSAKAKGAGSRP